MKEYRYDTFKKLFVAICDAIRKKESSTEPIAHQDIPDRIEALNVGSGNGVELVVKKNFNVVTFTTLKSDEITVITE